MNTYEKTFNALIDRIKNIKTLGNITIETKKEKHEEYDNIIYSVFVLKFDNIKDKEFSIIVEVDDQQLEWGRQVFPGKMLEEVISEEYNKKLKDENKEDNFE